MKEYFYNSIQYYLKYLSQRGNTDPIRTLITDFINYLDKQVTNEQSDYIKKNTVYKLQKEDQHIIETVLTLIKSTRVSKEYDDYTLKVIEDALKSVLSK